MLRVEVSISQQRLWLFDQDREVGCWPVSTATNGAGELNGSGCTPRGLHYIRACIGGGEPLNAVFVGRRPTGEIYSPALAKANPGRDWILTRILWLCGCEPGFNRLGDRDSQRRFIYIHGTPDTEPMGEPRSHGCIRMRNQDLIELYDRIESGTTVEIFE